MKKCSKCHRNFKEDNMKNIMDDFYVCPECFEKIKNFTSREYTQDEISENLIKYFWQLLEYWEQLPNKTTFEKLSGMLYSILSTLDGCSMDLPKFKVIPDTDPSDKNTHISFGNNWYPETDIDISGNLHDAMFQFKPDLKQNRLKKLRKIVKKNGSVLTHLML